MLIVVILIVVILIVVILIVVIVWSDCISNVRAGFIPTHLTLKLYTHFRLCR